MSGESPIPGKADAALPSHTERRQLVLKITLYVECPALDGSGEGDLHEGSLSGVGTSISHWGNTAYSFFGNAAWRLEAGELRHVSLDIHGLRISGFDCGNVRIAMPDGAPRATAGEQFGLDRPASYSDNHNDALAVQFHVTGALNHGSLKQLHLLGLADGFTFAEFLAAGESLGGAEFG